MSPFARPASPIVRFWSRTEPASLVTMNDPICARAGPHAASCTNVGESQF